MKIIFTCLNRYKTGQSSQYIIAVLEQMSYPYGLSLSRAFLLCVMTCSSLFSIEVTASTDRELYKKAEQAIKKKQFSRFSNYQKQLTHYPLYPYLEYAFLKAKVNTASNSQFETFLQTYPDLPVTPSLRKRWLFRLAKQQKWPLLLKYYQAQSDTALHCLYFQARLKNNFSEQLLEEIRDQWLVGKSLPNECDPAFDVLYKSHLMNDDLVWQRIQLSIEANNFRLANYLAKKLQRKYKNEFASWQKAHQNPKQWLQNSKSSSNTIDNDIVVYSIKRLARGSFNQALKFWQIKQQQHNFSAEQIGKLNHYLAIQAVRKDHQSSMQLLDAVPNKYLDKKIFLSKVKLALQEKKWATLLKWLDSEPPDDDSIKNAWYYWKARALQKQGYPYEADKAFAKIKNERDYYGFLAADYLNLEYGFNHTPIQSTQSIRKDIYELPAILRIKEFLELDKRREAIREWQWLIKSMDTEQLEQAALVASELKWNDRVIVTLGKGKLYNDLNLRFPLNFEKKIQWYSDKYHMDLSWVFALVRSESAFVETARSPAGALGLMQVMPATGRQTAKRLGWKSFNSNMLLKADNNIPIGSAYLKQMLNKFDNNIILATAAYNAGPHRVKKWLPDSDCLEPDIWIELIPFTETRQYVKRILYYANIYDWRFNQKLVPIKQRMSMVTPMGKHGMSSALNCSSEELVTFQ